MRLFSGVDSTRVLSCGVNEGQSFPSMFLSSMDSPRENLCDASPPCSAIVIPGEKKKRENELCGYNYVRDN